MIKHKILIGWLLLGTFCNAKLTLCQEDTTKVKEEIIIASDLFSKTDLERRQMLLKPKFTYINFTNNATLFKLGISPSFGQNINSFKLVDIRPDIVLSYEQKIGNSPFSFNLESTTRIRSFNLGDYDYKARSKPQTSGRVGGKYLTNGDYYNHRFRVDLSLRYYYNLKSRLKAEVSGNNLFSEYFFFTIKDVSAYSEVDRLNFTVDSQLRSQIRTRQWVSRPTFLSVGWGIQRSFLGKGLLDGNIEFGARFGKSAPLKYIQRDFLINLNLFIGLGL